MYKTFKSFSAARTFARSIVPYSCGVYVDGIEGTRNYRVTVVWDSENMEVEDYAEE